MVPDRRKRIQRLADDLAQGPEGEAVRVLSAPIVRPCCSNANRSGHGRFASVASSSQVLTHKLQSVNHLRESSAPRMCLCKLPRLRSFSMNSETPKTPGSDSPQHGVSATQSRLEDGLQGLGSRADQGVGLDPSVTIQFAWTVARRNCDVRRNPAAWLSVQPLPPEPSRPDPAHPGRRRTMQWTFRD